MPSERFLGKVALVTGAASGIGRAVAARLASEGASVVAADSSDEIEALAKTFDGNVHGMRCDVRRSHEVQAVVDTAMTLFGSMDVLCNIAGVFQRNAPLTEVEEDEFDRVLGTNLRGVFLGMKHGVPAMIFGGGGGAVVNVASIGGLVGRVGVSTYAASKGAVIQLSKSASLEYVREGVRINIVSRARPTPRSVRAADYRASPPSRGERAPRTRRRSTPSHCTAPASRRKSARRSASSRATRPRS
jgi:NAD(P)-dependent dehydrogenase (short-subunit alcohol dehydrogenase family)